MQILVPNLGSTSLKYKVYSYPEATVSTAGKIERIGQPGGEFASHRDAILSLLEVGPAVDGAAFKAVHAGPDYRGTFRVDDAFLAALSEYELAAPLHNRVYREALEVFRELRPELPLVAVVEPGFHRTIPDHATRYGVPADWAQRHGIRRYGFHGASHRYMSERVPAFLGREPVGLRVVSCHLGGSASMCAIRDGRSADVTMGFSPQSGLENATRHGDLDPFAVLFLMDREGWDTSEARRQLLGGCGLTGISGVAGGDMRDVEEAAVRGDGHAQLALDVFAYQVRKTIGAYAASMGGLDAIAFTGGIGENSATVRGMVCEGLAFLGVALDAGRNEASGDRRISRDEASVAVVVLATDEESIVSREAFDLLRG